MKSLTIRQPWCGAIFHGKGVENRTGAFTYRGPLAIHAGQHLADGGSFAEVERLMGFPLPILGAPLAGVEWTLGAVVGVVDLVEAHRWADCQGDCSPWAQPGKAHLQLANPRVLSRAVPAYGKQGLWTPDPDLAAEIRRHLA